MKKSKKILSLLACGAIAASATMGLAACGGDKDNTITVWAPQTQQTLVKKLVDDFLAANPDFGLKVDFGVCGEDNAYAKVSVDPQASADVYGFANDQLMNLKSCGGLSYLSDQMVNKIKETDEAAAVEAGKIGDKYYGYPYAADNGYFMYYDKSVVAEEDTTNLMSVINACKRKHKYFVMQMETDGAWYFGSFFYGAGGKYDLEWDGDELMTATCNFDAKAVDINGTVSDYSIGEIGSRAAMDAVNNKNAAGGFIHGNDTVIEQRLKDKNLGAVITGTWNASKIQEALGNNYAATACPQYTSSLDNHTYRMAPFIGYKLYAVNGFTKHVSESHRLAQYLASETAQQQRFNELQIGPSNLKIQQTEAVKNNVALQALFSQKDFAVVQTSLPDNYWSVLKTYAGDIYAGKITNDNLSTKLADLIKGLNVDNT
ncbi:MAG: extracellular solute-binding protein [Clostridia bacterium]|nr:extracellular solute-binding protein [Clostridia bacterium]